VELEGCWTPIEVQKQTVEEKFIKCCSKYLHDYHFDINKSIRNEVPMFVGGRSMNERRNQQQKEYERKEKSATEGARIVFSKRS
jgi:hypothetical protein